MLKNSFSSIKYLLILAFLLVVPMKAWGGFTGGTTNESFQLFSFWDLRGRDSFVQVTNTSGAPISVHVQIFDANSANCEEQNFDDTYSENDTHVYDFSALERNTPGLEPLGITLAADGYGFAVVTVTTLSNVLIGNFRVIDDSGYEYRANSIGFPNLFFANSNKLNFNNVGGANASDVVLIVTANAGTANVLPQGRTATFDVDTFNLSEDRLSSADFTFECAPGAFDVGINNAFPNSKGDPSIAGNSIANGFLRLILVAVGAPTNQPVPNFFGGFIGLNNGDGTGSMDTWITTFFSDTL